MCPLQMLTVGCGGELRWQRGTARGDGALRRFCYRRKMKLIRKRPKEKQQEQREYGAVPREGTVGRLHIK